MTIAEIINKLRQERDFGSRFPARIIFVDDLNSYSDLVSQLKSACDVPINLADFGKNDVVPQFEKMRTALEQYEGKQVLLLSVGEYLRMCIKRELNKERAQFPAFWECMQPESSKTRYIMPVFRCRDSFDRIIGKVDERQEGFIWELDNSPSGGRSMSLDSNSASNHYELHDPGVPYRTAKHYTISVYSPQFAQAINADADNFESWLRDWDIILSRDVPCTVITNQYRNTEASYGTISLKPIDSPFAYLSDLLTDAESLNKGWESDDFWAQLIPFAKRDMKFADLVLDQLGITFFDFVSVIARWKTLNNLQRKLIWMWYRVYPTDEYYSYACTKATKATQIPEKIRDEILLLSTRSDSWIDQRMAAMQVLSFNSFDDAYFKALDKLQLADMKLRLLTYRTHEEFTYAVKTVSAMLRDGVEPEAVAELLKDTYPSLYTYLSATSGIDAEVDEYLSWYRKNKIINRFPGQYPKHLTFDRFDARLKQLNKMNGKDCFILWIDGFGMEWLPVFLKELELRNIRPESKNIATAKLPTETEYNHQWNEDDPMSDKWGRLDSLSHHGMPDDKSYFSCVVYQLAVFSKVAKKVDELLDEHEYVAITGDHGSSRLAALAFHDTGVVPTIAPQHSKVRSFGRFCELSDADSAYPILDFMQKATLDGKNYVVMKDYNQFSVSGNAAGGNTDDEDVVGEIHGGNTPEERLVPVVIVKRSQPLPPMSCKSKNKFVTRRNGHVDANLIFNRNVFSLEISAECGEGVCSKNPDGTWDIAFDGVTGDSLSVAVIANGNLIADKVLLKVKGQGIDRNGGMGGLP